MWLTWEGVRALSDYEALGIASATHRRVGIVRTSPKPVNQLTLSRLPSDVSPTLGSVLFASRAWRLPWRPLFAAQLRVPLVLITAYHDISIKISAVEDLGPNVTRWFGVQCMTTHPTVTAMPLGVTPSMVPILAAGEQRSTRDILLYVNFRAGQVVRPTHAIRGMLWQHFSSRPWVTAEWDLSPSDYVNRLGRSKFVLSPRGQGWDCYRTYEAIAMGAIPIVQRCRPVTDVCERLPVLLIDRWSEVTEERLRQEWYTRQPKSVETMTMAYWTQQIQAARRAVEVSA